MWKALKKKEKWGERVVKDDECAREIFLFFYFLELPHEVKEVDRRGKMDDWEKATASSRDIPEEPHHWEEEGSSSCCTIL